MIKIRAIFLILFIASCGRQQNISQGLHYTKQTVAYQHIPDVDIDLQSLDIYHDKDIKDKLPVVIWVHGGAWCLGNKEHKIENKLKLFAREKYIFVSVNYRLSPYPYETNNPNRVKFPVHNQDVAQAIKWVYDNIERFGGDRNNMVLMGHSAGAHLVTLSGTNQSFLEDAGVPISAIKGIIAVDTEAYDIYLLIHRVSRPLVFYINAFGTDVQENISASPVYHLNTYAYYPKFLIFIRGNAFRTRLQQRFVDSLHQAGIEVMEVHTNSYYTHSEINEAIGRENEQIVTPVIVDFLHSCFE